MKKEILKISTVAVFLLSIVGCGSNSDKSSDLDSDKNVSVQKSRYEELLSYGVTPSISDYEDNDSKKILSGDFNLSQADLDWIHQMELHPNITLIDGLSWDDNTFVPFSPDIDKFSLLIIGDASFVEELETLKAHKDSINIPTRVKSWQDLTNAFYSYGVDDPERIKQAIAYYREKAQIQYVMLVGDSDKFPMRFCKNYATAGNYWVPTDLYYANLFKKDGSFEDWDGNGNGIFCETKSVEANPNGGLINIDEIEGGADIAVGRVPASSVEEVHNYITKVISYENNEYVQDWQKNNIMVVPGEFVQKGDIGYYKESYPRSLALKESIFNDFAQKDFSVDRLYYDTANVNNTNYYYPLSLLSRESLIQKINSGAGYINFAGHGANNGWWLGADEEGSLGFFDINAIDNLSNTDKYPIVFSVACDTGKFYNNLKYLDTDNNEVIMGKDNKNPPKPNPIQSSNYDIDSMAEAFLLHRDNAGAIAFIASTEATQGQAQVIDKYFANFYLNTFSEDVSQHSLGDLWRKTMLSYKNNNVDMNKQESNKWTASIPFDHLLKYHLFGDPSLKIEVEYETPKIY